MRIAKGRVNADGRKGTGEHTAKAMVQCFSSLSWALHDLVRQTPELYLYAKSINWGSYRRTYHTALALGCSRYVNDRRITPLLAPSFRDVAACLLLVDLRATAVTAASVITILQTCPLLEELDVGECSKMDALELARRLEVGRLQKLEIGGTGDGASWVGYRQEVGLAKGMGFAHNWYSRESGGAPDIGRPLQGVVNERFDKLGSRKVVPAVRAIEAIVHSLQQPAPFFCTHVNGCKNCLTFARFLPHDGCDEEPYDGRTYGQHRCMVCGEARFLCRGCVGYSYHYCAEEECQACVCVTCDGGRSVKAICFSDKEMLWEGLVEHGTTHFETVDCCMENDEDEPCQMPTEYKIVCKDKSICSGCGPNGCQTCKNWQCPWCEAQSPFIPCGRCCGTRCTECQVEVLYCHTCYEAFCTTCVRVRGCEDGCEPWKSLCGKEYAVWHCSNCYLKVHPPSTGSKD